MEPWNTISILAAILYARGGMDLTQAAANAIVLHSIVGQKLNEKLNVGHHTWLERHFGKKQEKQ